MKNRKTGSDSFLQNPFSSAPDTLPGSIFVTDFDDDNLEAFVSRFLNAEQDPGVQEIIVWVSSYGGDAYNGLAMADMVKYSTKPVWTVALGKAMSAGALLLSAGHKGRRCALPNSYIMVHEVRIDGFGGKTHEFLQQAGEMKNLNNRFLTVLAENSGKTVSELKALLAKKHNADMTMDAEQSKVFGIIDHIGLPKNIKQTAEGVMLATPPNKGKGRKTPKKA